MINFSTKIDCNKISQFSQSYRHLHEYYSNTKLIQILKNFEISNKLNRIEFLKSFLQKHLNYKNFINQISQNNKNHSSDNYNINNRSNIDVSKNNNNKHHINYYKNNERISHHTNNSDPTIHLKDFIIQISKYINNNNVCQLFNNCDDLESIYGNGIILFEVKILNYLKIIYKTPNNNYSIKLLLLCLFLFFSQSPNNIYIKQFCDTKSEILLFNTLSSSNINIENKQLILILINQLISINSKYKQIICELNGASLILNLLTNDELTKYNDENDEMNENNNKNEYHQNDNNIIDNSNFKMHPNIVKQRRSNDTISFKQNLRNLIINLTSNITHSNNWDQKVFDKIVFNVFPNSLKQTKLNNEETTQKSNLISKSFKNQHSNAFTSTFQANESVIYSLILTCEILHHLLSTNHRLHFHSFQQITLSSLTKILSNHQKYTYSLMNLYNFFHIQLNYQIGELIKQWIDNTNIDQRQFMKEICIKYLLNKIKEFNHLFNGSIDNENDSDFHSANLNKQNRSDLNYIDSRISIIELLIQLFKASPSLILYFCQLKNSVQTILHCLLLYDNRELCEISENFFRVSIEIDNEKINQRIQYLIGQRLFQILKLTSYTPQFIHSLNEADLQLIRHQITQSVKIRSNDDANVGAASLTSSSTQINVNNSMNSKQENILKTIVEKNYHRRTRSDLTSFNKLSTNYLNTSKSIQPLEKLSEITSTNVINNVFDNKASRNFSKPDIIKSKWQKYGKAALFQSRHHQSIDEKTNDSKQIQNENLSIEASQSNSLNIQSSLSSPRHRLSSPNSHCFLYSTSLNKTELINNSPLDKIQNRYNGLLISKQTQQQQLSSSGSFIFPNQSIQQQSQFMQQVNQQIILKVKEDAQHFHKLNKYSQKISNIINE